MKVVKRQSEKRLLTSSGNMSKDLPVLFVAAQHLVYLHLYFRTFMTSFLIFIKNLKRGPKTVIKWPFLLNFVMYLKYVDSLFTLYTTGARVFTVYLYTERVWHIDN